MRIRRLVFCACLGLAMPAGRGAPQQPPAVKNFIEANCLDCHEGSSAEGGLDLRQLQFNLEQADVRERWIQIHDRLRDGEMPPPELDQPQPVAEIGWSSRPSTEPANAAWSDEQLVLRALAAELRHEDSQRIQSTGRAKVRRMNRLEYENTLRHLLAADWLQIADLLPEDGIAHLFNKSGERLDVSHVQMTRYLATAEHALRLAINAAANSSQTRKFYAREEPVMLRYLYYRTGQTAATRSVVPLLGLTPETDILRKLKPETVGDTDPERREQEAMGVFSGAYSATTRYDFSRINAPTDGRYRLRFKTYTFMAGLNGASGGNDQGLTGGNSAWWRPDRNVAFPGTRSEPITLYAVTPSEDNRWLTTFDSHPEPTIFECVVTLKRGEGIRPDATRLVRTRPGWSGNPNATADGVPGFAMNWLEVEGPLQDSWPPDSYRAVLGDLPFLVDETNQIKAVPEKPRRDARRLLISFLQRATNSPQLEGNEVKPYLKIFDTATSLGQNFTDALISASAAILYSPEFLYLDALPGPLSAQQLEQRLAYFLWNGPPAALPIENALDASSPEWLQARAEQMLADPRHQHFINAFLDYWLELRDLFADSPDAVLYPDYYLDDWLAESCLWETRLFFSELIARNLPARNLVDADFTYVNERLAQHYGLPVREGVQLQRIELPLDSPRGGLLTQASVLRVTANGTTTSPVVRGAWIMERLIGLHIPPPPSGVSAVEPDIRGATTIRQQLELHRSIQSCNACHARFDPVGLGLESFDVAGGWRERYRATGDIGDPVKGVGKNGHAFSFKLAQPVDCSGQMQSGQTFADIQELKALLVSNERQLARNFVQQLVVFATGAPVSFADRAEVEVMLDRAAKTQYGIRSLMHEVISSKMFRHK